MPRGKSEYSAERLEEIRAAVRAGAGRKHAVQIAWELGLAPKSTTVRDYARHEDIRLLPSPGVKLIEKLEVECEELRARMAGLEQVGPPPPTT